MNPAHPRAATGLAPGGQRKASYTKLLICSANGELNIMSTWLDEKGIAGHFGICQRSVRNLRYKRILPFVKVGRIVLYNREDCDAALRKYQRNAV